jgi:hypothetical protein
MEKKLAVCKIRYLHRFDVPKSSLFLIVWNNNFFYSKKYFPRKFISRHIMQTNKEDGNTKVDFC